MPLLLYTNKIVTFTVYFHKAHIVCAHIFLPLHTVQIFKSLLLAQSNLRHLEPVALLMSKISVCVHVCVCVFAPGSSPAVSPVISALRMLSRQSSSDFCPLICAVRLLWTATDTVCVLLPAGFEAAVKQSVLVNNNRTVSVSASL